MGLLKLAAFDGDDLEVISAQMQDALVRVGDIHYFPSQRKLVIIANRFDWNEAETSKVRQRQRTGMTIANVSAMQSQKIRRDDDNAILSLLAITFEIGENPPEGEMLLAFSGGGNIRLMVECIEVELEDLGTTWNTRNIPAHD